MGEAVDIPIRPLFQLFPDLAPPAAPTAPPPAVDGRHDLAAFEHAQPESGDAQDLFAIAFENAPIGVAIVMPDGRYSDANPALCELLGRNREELRTLTWRDVAYPDDLPADEAAAATARRSGFA